MIVHPLFKPDSPLDSHSDTTSSEQVESHDQPSIVQPVNAAKSGNVNHHDYTSSFNRQAETILESVLEPVINPTSVNTSDNLVLSDSDDEGIHVTIIDRNPDTPSSST